MFLRFVGYLILAISLHGCQSSSIPKTASVVAEDNNVTIYLNREDGNEIPQVSLWLHYKDTGEEKRLVLTHPRARRDWQTYDSIMPVQTDSIATISRVTILSYGNEPLKLLVEGCPDYRNVESFIVTDNCKESIMLPTNAGLIGVTSEEYLLLMESYDYYSDGGRYSKVDAYDTNGKLINSMNVKTRVLNE